MDRVISLLAALVGLIALGGAILVHVNADTQRTELAAEIAQLKQSVGLSQQPAPVSVATAEPAPVQTHVPSAEHLPSSEPSAVSSAASSMEASIAPAPASSVEPGSSVPPAAADADVAAQLRAMQDKIAALEQANQMQASKLAEAQAQLSSQPPVAVAAASEAPTPQAAASSESGPTPAAVVADGPTKDCIPLGTRFMGTAGDSFPICKTKLVLKVASVTDGLATISGAGDVTVGGVGKLAQGCNVSVFSADTSGYAEMRVSCN